MFDFEDFIEYVYENPYDYEIQQRLSNPVMAYSKTLPPRKTAADRQREYRVKLKRENPEKLWQQKAARVLEHSRRKREKIQQRRQKRALEQKGKSEKETTEQLPCDGNDELLRTRPDIENRRNIRNLQRGYKRNKISEELRENIKDIMKKYKALERKSSRHQKRIDKLEETCKYLKTELNTLKMQNTTKNTEEGIDDSDLLHENEYTSSSVKVEWVSEDDPLSLFSQCKSTTHVSGEEYISDEDPLNSGPECNTLTNVKEEADTAADDSICLVSQ